MFPHFYARISKMKVCQSPSNERHPSSVLILLGLTDKIYAPIPWPGKGLSKHWFTDNKSLVIAYHHHEWKKRPTHMPSLWLFSFNAITIGKVRPSHAATSHEKADVKRGRVTVFVFCRNFWNGAWNMEHTWNLLWICVVNTR